MSGLIEKIKDKVHGDKHHSSSSDPASAKGHDSHAANKADPRIDSDRDGRANPTNTGVGSTTGTGVGSTTGTGVGSTTGSGTYGSGTTGSSTLGGDNYTSSGTGISGAPGSTTTGTHGTTGGLGSSNRGPHDSNLANKADPRVDSDRDHRANPASNVGSTGGEFGSSRTTGTGEFGSTTRSGAEYGTTGTTGGLGSSNRGPHDSNLANKADPRVDSDRDHRANPTTGGLSSNTGAYGTTGTTGGLGSSNRGPHDSNLANKADPRVDSDRDHRANPTSNVGATSGAYGSSTTGTHGTTGGAAGLNNPGPAPTTAGPHSKDILNKADPRVDSDRDGSKTVGQDQTYARS